MIPEIPLLKHTRSGLFFLIAGPCVIESRDLVLRVAETMTAMTDKMSVPYIFKASYKKANRSRPDSFTGIGDDKGLEILSEVRHRFNIPVLTDVHSVEEARRAAEYVDVIQIPAFLCRQTELLQAAAGTGKPVNIKKGQFLSPHAMEFAVRKVSACGNNRIIITERGTTFGYQDLVVDFRGIPVMQAFGYPVVLDVTHSLQQPNQPSGVTGGQPALIATLARAGIAAGADGIFMETHPEPSRALSDGANMLPLQSMADVLDKLITIHRAVHSA
ncbi:MAG: 3-deoxy-8-phosphooctulonate synthase [Bacteroidales bacterium]